MSEDMIRVTDLSKGFTLHLQDGLRLPVLEGIELTVARGDCLALAGPSGCGKSTLLRCLYANYLPPAGAVHVYHEGGWVDLGAASARQVLEVRRRTLGYVSQFLRAVPRVSALELVAEPLRRVSQDNDAARQRAGRLLAFLNLPERLWALPPATFSGGEQQRVNIARGFAGGHPVLLLDEPTASLDEANRDRVVTLIRRARDAGTAIVGIFHDDAVREAVCNRRLEMDPERSAA